MLNYQIGDRVVGEIYIELDSPVPGDITDGSWVSVKTSRIDLW